MSSNKHWIASGILDIGDKADGKTLALVHCDTHRQNEWHWLDDTVADAIERFGPEPGWIYTEPFQPGTTP